MELARALGGSVLLRIEDIDIGRSRTAFVAAIKDDLHWLGATWPEPVLMQSQRFDTYRDASQRLRDLGVLYPCAATRAEIQVKAEASKTGHDPDGAPLYPGRGVVLSEAETNQRVSAGQPYALRLDIEKANMIAEELLQGEPLQFSEFDRNNTVRRTTAHPERWGDVVIVRKDVPTSYHLAVVVDDAFQGITHVTRGRDLYHATDIQRLLQVLLGAPEPIYHHHALILDNTGKKLSKSNQATSLQSLRKNGSSPDDIKDLIKNACEPL